MATTTPRARTTRPAAEPHDPDGGHGEIHDQLTVAVSDAARLLRADGAMVYLLDPATGHLRFAHDAGISSQRSRDWVRSIDLPIGTGLFGRAVAERGVVWTDDYIADSAITHAEVTDRVVEDIGIRSMVAAPLVHGDTVFGALGAFSSRAAAFDESQIALVRTLAQHAAAAMANSRLIEALDQSRTELAERAEVERTLREIAARISSAADLPAVLQRAVDEAARLLRADGARIDLVDADSRMLRWAYASGDVRPTIDEWPDDPDETLDEGVSGQAVVGARPVWTGDYLHDPRFPHGLGADTFVAKSGIQSVLAAPLIGEGGAFGALTVYSDRPDAWHEPDAGLLVAIADQAAITITTTRLIAQLGDSRAALARRAEGEQALREIAARITVLREPAEILQDVVIHAKRLVRADGVILDLLDESTGHLHWAYDDGLAALFSAEERSLLWIAIGDGATGTAVAEDRVIVAGDDLVAQYPPSPESSAFYERTGFHSMIAAPITGDDGPLGAIEVYARTVDAFSAIDAGLIGALASQAAIAITNARLVSELARSRTEHAKSADAERTLREMAGRVSAMRDQEEILQSVIDAATRLLQATGVTIDRIDRDGMASSWVPGALDGAIEQRDQIGEMQADPDAGISGLAMTTQRVTWTDEYLEDDRFNHTPERDAFVRATGTRSVIAAPVVHRGTVLGVINAHSDQPAAFDDADAARLGALADQSAVAIANALLIEDLERSRLAVAHRADTERSLRDITAAITALHEPHAILERVVKAAKRLLATDGAHLTRMADDGSYLVPMVVAGDSDDITAVWLKTMEFPLGGGINGLAAQLGEPVFTEDYLDDPRIPQGDEDREVASRLGLRGMAAAPLRAPGGEVIGTLAVSSAHPRAFEAEELDLLQGLADQAAIAITNSTLLQRLRDSEVRYRFLVENSPDVVFATDADGVFTFMSEAVTGLTGYHPDEVVGQHFSTLVGTQTMDQAVAGWERLVADPATQQVVEIELLGKDGRRTPAEVHSLGIVDETGGFGGIHGATRDTSERDRLQRELRRQAGELAAGEERAHLARELHDSVTQALFSMSLVSRSVEMLLDRDPDAARTQLAQLRDLQREALAEMRALIFELRPGNLEEDGLTRALKTHTAALQGRIGLPVVVESELDERLPLQVEETLYRIAQEALHNVVKHAAAQQVRVEVGRVPGGVRLRVIDDGTGFDPGAVAAGHLGIAGMQARATRIGATFACRSQTGRGTTIEVHVPDAAAGPVDVTDGSRRGPEPSVSVRDR